jgi:hypothetical protein
MRDDRGRRLLDRGYTIGAMRIGFIGFGEAGFTIGNGLRDAGLEQLFAYDIAADTTDRAS